MNSKERLKTVYLAGFLMSAHFALISYVNSSFLGQFVSIGTLNILYIIGSLLDICLLLLAPFLLKRYGNISSFLFFIVIEILAVVGMGFLTSPWFVILLFIIQLSLASILYFWLDLCLEQETKIESATGDRRGALLTFSNIAWVISPLALTILISQNNFSRVYFLAGLFMIVLLPIVGLSFKSIKNTNPAKIKIFSGFKLLWKTKDQLRIAFIQFILNFFYSWMVIYLPLLLSRQVGFSWDKIGVIFTIMLLPFLLLEWPAGVLADKKIGEKEILVAGILIMSGATFLIPPLSSPIFWIWATVLFATRVGASLVEIASETYFFKHVREKDASKISVFRMVRSFSYVLAPLIAWPVIYFFSYSASFYFLAAFTLLGLLFIPKVDTK
ncbi:MAG: MFS transporter [Patescibacteria group bacterium]|nr:MFS transporter [Patescibacteria group bacterium]